MNKCNFDGVNFNSPMVAIKLASTIFIIIGVIYFGEASAENQKNYEDTARKVAEKWLEVVDRENYSDSWDMFTDLFKQKVTREAWVDELTKLRASVGNLSSRSLIGARYAKNLPEAPEGEYVIVQYESAFIIHESVLETVVVIRDPDNQWRVAGYYIQGDLPRHTSPD